MLVMSHHHTAEQLANCSILQDQRQRSFCLRGTVSWQSWLANRLHAKTAQKAIWHCRAEWLKPRWCRDRLACVNTAYASPAPGHRSTNGHGTIDRQTDTESGRDTLPGHTGTMSQPTSVDQRCAGMTYTVPIPCHSREVISIPIPVDTYCFG